MARSTAKVKGGLKAGRELDKLRANLKDANLKVVAGLPKNSPLYPGGESVIEVGHKNEFGSMAERIPERSFLRTALKKHEKKYRKLAKRAIEKALAGGDLRKEAGRIGLEMEGDIQDMIVEVKTPPNAPYTIAQKGSSNPLIDSGHMRQSIRHEVRKNES